MTAPRWGLPDAAICFFAGVFGATVAVQVWVAISGDDVETMGVTVAGLIGLWIGLVGSMAVVTRSKGSGSLVEDFALRFELPRDLRALAIGAVFQLVAVPLLYLPFISFISDLSERLEAPARELENRAGEGLGIALLAVLVTIGAPIVEELFYRGLLLEAIRRRFGSRIAIGGSALVFGVAHFELLQFPALFALGILLGVLVVRSGRLGPAIVAHAGFNAVTMVVLILNQ